MALVKIGVPDDGNGALESYDTLGGGESEIPTFGDALTIDDIEYVVVDVERHHANQRRDVVQVSVERRDAVEVVDTR